MEKYVAVLAAIAIALFAFCTFPILGKTANDTYLVCDKDSMALNILTSCELWENNGYLVFKLDENGKKYADAIPGSKKVEEYFFDDAHSINMRNPFLQMISTGGQTVCGIPYVIG